MDDTKGVEGALPRYWRYEIEEETNMTVPKIMLKVRVERTALFPFFPSSAQMTFSLNWDLKISQRLDTVLWLCIHGAHPARASHKKTRLYADASVVFLKRRKIIFIYAIFLDFSRWFNEIEFRSDIWRLKAKRLRRLPLAPHPLLLPSLKFEPLPSSIN